MSTMSIDSMNFMPSDVARLVLGYLLTKKYVKTYKMLIHECKYLEEYLSLKRKGMNPPLTVYGLDLEKLLDDYAALKAAEHQRYDVGTDSLWKQFDILTQSLKAKTSARQLKMQGDNQSTRMRRMLADNRKRLCLKKQLRSVQNKLKDSHVSPDSNSKSPETAKSTSFNFGTTHSEEDVDNIRSEDDTAVEDSVIVRSFNDTFTTCTDSEVMEVHAASPLTNTTSTVVNSPGFTTVREQSVSHQSKSLESCDSQEENPDKDDQSHNSDVAQQIEKTKAPVLDPDKESPQDRDSSKPTEISESENKASEKMTSMASRSTGRRRRGHGRNSKADTPSTGGENRRVTRSAKKNLQFPSSETQCAQITDTSMEEKQTNKDDERPEESCILNEPVTAKNPVGKPNRKTISLNKASSICDKTSSNVDTNVSSDKEHSGISAVSQEPLSNMPLSNMESSRQINQSSNSVLPLHLNSEIMDHSGVLLQTNEPSCSVTNSGSDIVVNNKQSSSTISKAKGQEVVSSLGDGTPENIAQNVAAVTEPNTDHLNKRKRHLRKKQGVGKIGDRKNLLQNENSMDTEDGSRLSSVYDSNIPTFYEQILNNPLLHEKLAQNINKQLLNNSLNKSKDRSTHNASADMSAGPSQLTDSVVLASDVAKSLKDATEVFSPKPVQAPDKQMSNSLNTDLHDILDLHETRMSEGTVAGILDMTKSDPLFESLFNLFAPYSADPASESNLPQKTDFSGITLEMGKEAKTDNSTCKGDKVRSRHNTSKNSTANISMPSFTDCPEPSHTSSEENLIMEILQSPQVNSCLKTSEDVEMTSPVKEHTLSSASVATTTVSDLFVSSSRMTTDSSILPVTTAGMSYLTSSADHSLHKMGLHALSSLELCSSQHTLPFSQTVTSSVQPAIHSSHTAIQTGVPAIQPTCSQSNHHTIHSTGSPVVHSPAVYDVVSSSPFHSPITSACSPVSRAHKIGEMGCMSRSPLCGEKLNQLQEQQEMLLGKSRSECDKLTNNTCLNDIEKKSLDQNLHNRGAVAVFGTNQEMEVTSSSSQDLRELPSTSVSLPVFPIKSLLFTDSQSNNTDSESQERYKCTVTQSQGLSILSLKETNEEKARKSRKKSKSRSLNSSKEDNGPKEISYTSFLNEVQEAENSSTPVVTKTVSMTTREEVISPQESITKEMMSFVTMLKEGLNPKRNAKPKVKTPKAQAKKGRKRNEDKKPKPKVLKDQWSPDLKALVQIVTAEKSPVDQKKSPPKRNKKAEKSPINDRKAAPTTCTRHDRIQSKGRSPGFTNLTPTLNKVSDDIKVQDLPIVKMSHHSVSEHEADQSRITPPSVHSCSDSRSKDNLMEVSYLGYETEKLVKNKECDVGQNEEENPLPRISLFKTSMNTQNSKSMDVCSGTVHCEPKELDSSITSNYVESPKSIENDLRSTADQCVSGKSSEEDEGCSEKSSLTSISSIKMSLLNKLKKSAEKKLESALKSKHSSQSEQRHVHFDSENDETDGNICLSSAEGENKILSMPTLDSLITNKVSSHSLATCSTSKEYRQSKVVQEQNKVVSEFSNSTIGPQIGCETAQPVMSAQNYVTPTGCVVQKQTESECDYSKIMYSENQDFLELGSPGNTVNSTDCDSPAISNIRTSLSESFAGTSRMRQSLGVMISNSVEEKLGNVIDIHFCSPDSLHNSVASQNIMYGDQVVGSVPVNTVIQNIGGNPGNTNSALPQQIVILPPQQNIAGNIIDISLPTAVSSSNLTQTEVQPQMSFTISDPNLVTTKSCGSVLASSSLQSEQQIQMGGVLTQDFVMSEQYRDVIAQYNSDAQESGNKLIAVPVGMQVPNKNFHVKSLNFGPEAEEKVRQLGFGRERKKSVEEKKARKDRNTQNMQNWRRRQKTKEGETQQNTKVKERRLRGKKTDTVDLIPDKSLTVFMDKGDVQLKEMPKKPSLDSSRQNVEIDNSDFIPDNSGMVFLNQKKVTRVKVPTTARKNSSFRKPLLGKCKSNVSIDKSPNVINSVIPQSFSETPSTRQPQLLSKKLIFNMEDCVQNDQFSITTDLSGNVSQAQNSQNVVCTTESSGTEMSSRSNIIRRSSVSSVIKPQDLQKKAVEQENSDDSDIDVDGEWECTLTVKNAESRLNDLVCDKLITDSNTTTENSAVTASIVSQSDQVSSLSKVPSRRCSGNNSLFSIQCNYGDSSEDNSDSATEDDLSDSLGRKKFSSQNQHDSFAPKGNSVTASSNLLHTMYTTGTVSSAYATFANAVEELSGRNEQNHSFSLGTIQASAKSIENDDVCQNPSVGTMIVHSGSPCSSIYSENNGPHSVESVNSSLGASPWSTGSIQSPSSVQEGQKSKFNLLMTPPKKRITATLKSGEGFYYYHSSSAAKENSTLPVTPEKQECDKSLKVLPKSPKTPKGKRTPVKFDSVRRSPRLVMSPSQRIRSQLAVSGASAPGSDKKRNNLFGVKRAREESSEHIERKTKKAKAGKKTVDLGKVDLDKFLSKIHKK